MFLAQITDPNTGRSDCNLYDDSTEAWHEFFHKTFSPDTEYTVIPLHVTGKTYAERKACVEEIALLYSNTDTGGLSWGEYEKVSTFFVKNALRYGLLGEFRDEGII